jgi:RimJ/RimL family protein N-acetyltransferase
MYYGYDPLRQEAELGITIGNKDFWGKGHGREVIDLMVEVMGGQLSLVKVYLHTLTWNERAQRSFAAGGFTRVGEVVRAGRSYYRMERLLL